ncbi:uncharacterized protein LOC119580912 [Penaeus monodon]|uniref:uncharacterized protein LOC119580912 n=1 Tax=Penaeus monodon TaxID=6687 RepID=UPI0018A6E29A|nr:uncharacterized protein LOC119580912 [Penaeus monodon]
MKISSLLLGILFATVAESGAGLLDEGPTADTKQFPRKASLHLREKRQEPSPILFSGSGMAAPVAVHDAHGAQDSNGKEKEVEHDVGVKVDINAHKIRFASIDIDIDVGR